MSPWQGHSRTIKKQVYAQKLGVDTATDELPRFLSYF